MKRTDLIKKLKAAGATFDHEGANHTVYKVAGQIITVPRHREINEYTANGILKDAAEAMAKKEKE